MATNSLDPDKIQKEINRLFILYNKAVNPTKAEISLIESLLDVWSHEDILKLLLNPKTMSGLYNITSMVHDIREIVKKK